MRWFSDVYVFGLGEDVKKDQLNALASKKRGENHVFVLKDYDTLGEVFNSIISEWIFFSHQNQLLAGFFQVLICKQFSFHTRLK